MRVETRLSAVLIICFTYTMISAQESKIGTDTLFISLQTVWNKALQASRSIKISSKSVMINTEDLKDVRMERFPEIGVSGSIEKATNIPIYDHGLFSAPSQHEVIHTLYRTGLDFYQNIYNGNKLNLKISEEQTLLSIAQIKKDQSISDIKYLSSVDYLDLQKSIIFRELALQDIADQEEQLAEIKAFHDNDVVLASAVLRSEMELSKRKLSLLQIENDIKLANQKLNILIGEPDERIVKPSTIVIPSQNELPSYESCIETAKRNAFSFLISNKQTELSRLHLQQIKANIQPKIGMYGEFYYANPQIFLYPYNPYWYSLGIAGIKMSFPISSIYHNIHKTRAAILDIQKEKEQNKDIYDKVRQKVKEAYLRYQEALAQIEVAETNVALAKENARIIKNQYFNQATLITDLLDANVLLLRSRFDLAAAKILAQNKYYLLLNVMGIL